MEYGKLENGNLVLWDSNYIVLDGKRIFNPSLSSLEKAGIYPIKYLEGRGDNLIVDNELVIYLNNNLSLKESIEKKLQEIDKYDSSSEVNIFYLGNDQVWLPKADRVGLMNSCTILKSLGELLTTLWFEGKEYVILIDLAIHMLQALEVYALNCYNVTAQHKSNVSKMTDPLLVDLYNYKINYPNKLRFEL